MNGGCSIFDFDRDEEWRDLNVSPLHQQPRVLPTRVTSSICDCDDLRKADHFSSKDAEKYEVSCSKKNDTYNLDSLLVGLNEITERQQNNVTCSIKSDDLIYDKKGTMKEGVSSSDSFEVTSYVTPEKRYDESFDMKISSPVGPEDFDLCRVIGKGSFGKVFLVRKMTGSDKGTLFAMKVVRKAMLMKDQKDTEHMKTERSILEKVRHPFIVNLVYAFQTSGKLYLIMDYISGGELYTYLDKEGMFLEDTVRFYAAELILAISHLHELGIVYRDLKPENILLDKDGHVILTDFGLSKTGLNEGHDRTNTFCGTMEYMAPEILSRNSYDKSVDWWSLGILMYDMLVGRTPFISRSRQKTMETIQYGKLKLPSYLTSECQDLLRRLLKKDPKSRLGTMSSNEIKSHPFFKTTDWDQCLLKKTLPKIRPTILTDDEDVSHFAPMFTSMPVVDTPSEFHDTNEFMDVFYGFSYVDSRLIHSTTTMLHTNRTSNESILQVV